MAECYGLDELGDSEWDEWEAYDAEFAEYLQESANEVKQSLLLLFKHFGHIY